MTIQKIESITYDEAVKDALEIKEIKGHQVIFINLGEDFGFSALVFKDKMHIYYANDYELHHKNLAEQGNEVLRDYYENVMQNKLYLRRYARIGFTLYH